MPGIIALAVAVAVACVLVYATTKPNQFRVQRSVTMKASPERVFTFIDDLSSWPEWSPFEKNDPAMKKSYSGPKSGPGAACAWDGNRQAGAGRMEIMSTVPGSKVVVKLDFLRPFKAHNTAEFTMEPAGGSTRVTWAVYGPQKYMLKVMSLFIKMDRMMGREFEEGLGNLKRLAETVKTVGQAS